MNHHRRMIIENNEFGSEHREKERKRAMEALKKAESFVVFTNDGSSGGAISAIDNDDIPYIMFYCNKMMETLIGVMEETK